MKKAGLSLIIIFLLFARSLVIAGQGEVDSLLQLLSVVEEVEKATIYNQLAIFNTKNSPGLRIEYGTKALDIARAFGQKEEEFHALVNIATGYAYLGNNTKALEYDLIALDIAKEINNDKFLSSVYIALGYDYYYLGNYEKSLGYNLKSLEIKNQMIENGLLKTDKNLAHSYNNIGATYNLLKQFQKSLEYHLKALEIRKKLSDSTGIARSLHNFGSVYEKQKEYKEALKYYQEALALRKRLGSKREIAETLNNLGNIMKFLNDNEKALGYYNEALHIFTEINDKGRATFATNNIAGIYLKQKKPAKAYPYIIEGIELAIETGQKKTLGEIYINLADYYVLTDDYKNAFKTQEKLLILKDTLFSNNLTEKVSEMQTKYETEKKEKEIELLTKDSEIKELKIKKQSVQLYFLIAFIILITVVVLLIFSKYKFRQKHLRIKLEMKNLETEQRLLRSQMNPHFIFNSMNSIQSYISGNDSFTAMTYLSKFAQLMRNILDNSRKSLIALSDEINTLELYMELESIRFNKKFDCKIEVDPELPVDAIYIPPMLIQPFVENSIKHGLRNKKSKGLLEIEFRQNNKLITCIVKDNGIGREKAMELNKEKNKTHQSLGMQVTRERLDALSKEKGININFEITNLINKDGKASGTQVLINLPFEIE
ncbi:MAG: tetratricopeptide repeat protein [Bacteroidales bacterium]|nr:tetratricopeptide repeat protein [Bacteroidales bacterium]